MRTGLRPALRLAGERLESALYHLTSGIRWMHGTHDVEDDASSVYYFLCALDFAHEAADIAALHLGILDGICEDCEILVATDGELCAGCHDSRGEAQDERAAS